MWWAGFELAGLEAPGHRVTTHKDGQTNNYSFAPLRN